MYWRGAGCLPAGGCCGCCRTHDMPPCLGWPPGSRVKDPTGLLPAAGWPRRESPTELPPAGAPVLPNSVLNWAALPPATRLGAAAGLEGTAVLEAAIGGRPPCSLAGGACRAAAPREAAAAAALGGAPAAAGAGFTATCASGCAVGCVGGACKEVGAAMPLISPPGRQVQGTAWMMAQQVAEASQWMHVSRTKNPPAPTCGLGAAALGGGIVASSWLTSSCGSESKGSVGAAAATAAVTASAAATASLLRGALEELPGERDGWAAGAAAPAPAASMGLAAGPGLEAGASSAAGDSCSSCSCAASMLQLSWAPTLGSGTCACTCTADGDSSGGCWYSCRAALPTRAGQHCQEVGCLPPCKAGPHPPAARQWACQGGAAGGAQRAPPPWRVAKESTTLRKGR